MIARIRIPIRGNRRRNATKPRQWDPADRRVSQGVLCIIAGAILTIIGVTVVVFAVGKPDGHHTKMIIGPMVILIGCAVVTLGTTLYILGRRQKQHKATLNAPKENNGNHRDNTVDNKMVQLTITPM